MFSYFSLIHKLWVVGYLLIAVLTCTHDLCSGHKVRKNITMFHLNIAILQPLKFNFKEYEPRREKTGFLHMRKQRRRSASR